MKRKNILIVFGTRPETIRMAPIIKEMQKQGGRFRPIVCAMAHNPYGDGRASSRIIKAHNNSCV